MNGQRRMIDSIAAAPVDPCQGHVTLAAVALGLAVVVLAAAGTAAGLRLLSRPTATALLAPLLVGAALVAVAAYGRITGCMMQGEGPQVRARGPHLHLLPMLAVCSSGYTRSAVLRAALRCRSTRLPTQCFPPCRTVRPPSRLHCRSPPPAGTSLTVQAAASSLLA